MCNIQIDPVWPHVSVDELARVKASEEQLNRIETLARELTDLCGLPIDSANQLIFYSIIKWQNETELNYEDGLIMTFTERLRHKTRMYEIGKDCISQVISFSEDLKKVCTYIERKMYQYLNSLIETD